ncbi:hypothetical protein DYBT9275_00623 [Dyadobacter sp. CECT 9275]|uniref:EamA domain-containing protein n=1 Tax=Dyadobacter helix TaxID=2822344 RepID=A0A916NAJ4_9BACT|nr:DMT family transporter [Dyadobacter sp. CECT 9275]CAG4990834.1 hypothetical protein DYBT9275_00623 [Dyadobacter sp. CECT 9275]
MVTSATLRSYLHLHFLVLIWGFTAVVGLMVSVSPIVLVFYRTFIAVAGLAIVIWVKRKSFSVFNNADLGKMLLTGIILASHWILFFASARVSTASVCLAGMATTSLWTSFIEPFVNKKPVKPLEVALGMMAFAGLYVVFRFEFNHALGLGLALASALLCAIFTVVNSRLVKRYDGFVITFYEMIGASIFTLAFAFVARWQAWTPESPIWPAAADWIWILFLALVCTVYAAAMSVELMKQFSAYLINLTINLEPVYGIALAFFFFGEKERMTSGFYLGTLLILMAVLLYPVLSRWQPSEKSVSGS